MKRSRGARGEGVQPDLFADFAKKVEAGFEKMIESAVESGVPAANTP